MQLHSHQAQRQDSTRLLFLQLPQVGLRRLVRCWESLPHSWQLPRQQVKELCQQLVQRLLVSNSFISSCICQFRDLFYHLLFDLYLEVTLRLDSIVVPTSD